jgi:hypothetical protein
VGYLVNGEKEVLVGSRTDDVGGEKELPGQDGCIAQEVCAEHLYRYNEGDKIFGEGLRPTELCYLIQESEQVRKCIVKL